MSAEELFGTQIHFTQKKKGKKEGKKKPQAFLKGGLTAFSVQILIRAAKRVE